MPPSSVSNRLTPCTIVQKCESVSGMIELIPRWPGGWFAGSSQRELPGAPASVVRSENVLPPSDDSKIPGASAPTSKPPPVTARFAIFETLRGSSSP